MVEGAQLEESEGLSSGPAHPLICNAPWDHWLQSQKVRLSPEFLQYSSEPEDSWGLVHARQALHHWAIPLALKSNNDVKV
jgi:hypothetical protein